MQKRLGLAARVMSNHSGLGAPTIGVTDAGCLI